jgi:hypothetical protein
MATKFVALQEPIGTDGIRTVNFFNGRLLTGGDMSREQAARREADARIGLALGDGVASGLEVTYAGLSAPGKRPAVTISPGVAVNRTGHVLCVTKPVELALSRAASPAASNVACLFDDCAPPAEGDFVGNAGLFMLTIGPAFTSEGRAQVSGLADANARCATDATVEAVQFRLLQIRPELFEGTTYDDPDFRNQIAYRAFGKRVLADWPANLLASSPRDDDLIEEMRGHGLQDSEVPLALIAFDGAYVHHFTDNWSVRRPLDLRDPDTIVSTISEPRRLKVGRAMFRQFQAEIDDIGRVSGALAKTDARTRFGYLPPAGFLPVLNDKQVFDFFAPMTVRGPVHIDASAVEPLLRESFAAPAIDTKSDHVVWLYRIAQTRMTPRAAPILLFASGHLPYRGDARFNLNHWNFANYALTP